MTAPEEPVCPECLEPYAHHEVAGDTCLECREEQDNKDAQFEDELHEAAKYEAEFEDEPNL